VRHVAVDEPPSRLAGGPDHVVPLPWADVDRVLQVPGGRRERVSVGRHNRERATVNVHRMGEVVVAADEAMSSFWPTFMAIVSVAGYAFPLIVK